MKAADWAKINDALRLLQELANKQEPSFSIEVNGVGTSVISGDGSFLCHDAEPEAVVATLKAL